MKGETKEAVWAYTTAAIGLIAGLGKEAMSSTKEFVGSRRETRQADLGHVAVAPQLVAVESVPKSDTNVIHADFGYNEAPTDTHPIAA